MTSLAFWAGRWFERMAKGMIGLYDSWHSSAGPRWEKLRAGDAGSFGFFSLIEFEGFADLGQIGHGELAIGAPGSELDNLSGGDIDQRLLVSSDVSVKFCGCEKGCDCHAWIIRMALGGSHGHGGHSGHGGQLFSLHIEKMYFYFTKCCGYAL
jgi:hypothetical protein